jgi:tetratricopeptide (TPR) repeat protein
MKPSVPAKSQNRAIFQASAIIALAALFTYGSSFLAPFVFDSASIVAYNPTLHHLASAWRTPHDGSTVDGRPLLNLSLALNYAISGTQVWSYHALNLLIHILAGLTLFGILRHTLEKTGTGDPSLAQASEGRPPVRGSEKAKLEKDRRTNRAFFIAFAAALLWTLHPLQTEAVTYVIQRAESMMGLFYLLTLYCFIRGARLRPPGGCAAAVSGLRDARSQKPEDEKAASRMSLVWYGLAWLACFSGMATKEVMVTAPVIVFLYDRTFLAESFLEAWRRRRGVYLGLAASWILLAVLELGTGSRNGTAGFGAGLRWSDYALTQIYAVGHYLQLALWPRPLIFDYGTAVVTQTSRVLPAALVLVFLAVGTLVALVRRPALGFLGAWFFAILAPTCLVPVATQTMAEHRMYLPLAAVVVLAALGIGQLSARASRLIFMLLAVGLGALTLHRNETYLSEVALWSDNVAKLPDDARAHNNLGNALYLTGDVPGAGAQYAEALRLQPEDNPEAQYNLALCFLQEHRLPEAIAHASEAVRLAPGNANGRLTLGNALAESNRLPEAMAQYQAAVRINPDFPEAHNNLGKVWYLLGKKSEAIAEYEEALRINPNYADARASLQSLQAAAGTR